VQAVELAPKLYPILHPDYVRYRAASGGRDSAKSHSFGRALLLRLMDEPMRALCAREYQNSITESVHRLLVSLIDELRLDRYFEISDRSIVCTHTGSEVIFAGLHHNAPQLKSLEGIKICWVEEAANVSVDSLQILLPTIRAAESECWFSFNPDQSDAAIEQFRESGRPDVRHVHVTWRDNPWHSKEFDADREAMQRTDPDLYAHIWLGECRTHSEAIVFKGKYSIEAFVPGGDEAPEAKKDRRKDALTLLGHNEAVRALERKEWDSTWQGPYLGLDWGFSVDPLTCVKCWIFNKRLYIEHEAWKVGCELNHTPDFLDENIPDARRYVIRADSARPEAISYMCNHGYPKMAGVRKGKGSVEDGVAFLKSFEQIIVHPRCVHVAEEFRTFSYRVDRLSGDVLPDLKPGNDHGIDALRYALEPVIRNRGRSRSIPLMPLIR
jgi:phage terminase large subunit